MVIEVAALYLAVGVGCAVASMWSPPRRVADAVVLVGLWPLLGPLLLARPAPDPDAVAGARAFVDPDGELAARAAAATRKLAALDRALERPELDPRRAAARVAELEEAGAERALAVARRRAEAVARLASRRNRLAGELEELAELLAQLETQSEIVCLTGVADVGGEPVSELIADIEARLYGVEQLLEENQ